MYMYTTTHFVYSMYICTTTQVVYMVCTYELLVCVHCCKIALLYEHGSSNNWSVIDHRQIKKEP